MDSRDYYRAISLYKELSFYSNNTDSIIFYKSQIGKAYQNSNKLESSILTYSDLINNYNLSESAINNFKIRIGINYLKMNYPQQAYVFFKDSEKTDSSCLSKFYLAFCNVKSNNWDNAKRYYREIIDVNKNCNKEIGKTSNTCLDLLNKRDNITYKSPFLSTLFSTLIPGVGQLYCGHVFDAAQAFGFVGAFSFATYSMYKYDKNFSSNYVLTIVSSAITVFFHIANIIGANKTAYYYNQKQNDLLIREIEKPMYKYDF